VTHEVTDLLTAHREGSISLDDVAARSRERSSVWGVAARFRERSSVWDVAARFRERSSVWTITQLGCHTRQRDLGLTMLSARLMAMDADCWPARIRSLCSG
jgi:hypothetical protein